MCIAPGSACSPACPNENWHRRRGVDCENQCWWGWVVGRSSTNVKAGYLQWMWLIWHTAEQRCASDCCKAGEIHRRTWGNVHNVCMATSHQVCLQACVRVHTAAFELQAEPINKGRSETMHESSPTLPAEFKRYLSLLALFHFTRLTVLWDWSLWWLIKNCPVKTNYFWS